MVEDPEMDDSGYRRDRPDPVSPWRLRGSGIIFVLVAIALILAIGFFYMTRDDGGNVNSTLESSEPADSAARVVGNAALNAADMLRNDH